VWPFTISLHDRSEQVAIISVQVPNRPTAVAGLVLDDIEQFGPLPGCTPPGYVPGDGGSELGRMRLVELLELYRAIPAELRKRGVIRSANVISDYAEWLVARASGGKLSPKSAKGFDIVDAKDERLQVKARVVSDPPKAGQFELGKFTSWLFDAGVIVLFHDDLRVRKATYLPRETLKAKAGKNSDTVVAATPDVLAAGEDWTEKLRAAAVVDPDDNCGPIRERRLA
jgi:hypothetical protein